MILSAIGSIVSGIAAMSQASYQAAIAKANEQQARLNAQHAKEIGDRDAEDIGTENRGLLGEQLAGQAASGLQVGSPSAVRARGWLSRVSYDEQVRRVEAANREYANYQTQGNVFAAEAKMHKSAGAFAMIGGILNAGASLVGAGRATSASPGFLPTSTVRNRYYTAPAAAPVVRTGARVTNTYALL